MVGLCVIKGFKWLYLGGDRPSTRLIECLLIRSRTLLGCRLLRFAGGENSGAVLGTNIVALAIALGRIMLFPKTCSNVSSVICLGS
ncbi:hypothetical protein HORIV_36530 [Vreelandella olivaria]|uniref:Uncharacterized protein n=1 Tax=Vreelandella olivaria TaxID=390919 RepID=A0ABM7GKG4_9GAMM|nr:hypothetical protein HORIV_36530 [Halomonas olivaria]